ncbi:MAG: hypothetical protein QOE31_2311, partial [Solirubrobacteraceae bacterium]|nr:hypothetical protein [Solirubrobacteraceae bacterium]
MMPDMAATPGGRMATATRELRRDPANGIVAGVCAGLGKRWQVDPLLLRIVFAATTLASGIGLVLYVMAWMLLPKESDAGAQPATARGRSRRGAVEVSLGVGCLLLAVLLAFRELGLPFSDVLTWPLVLVAAGGALIWRQSLGSPDAVSDITAPPRGQLSSATADPAAAAVHAAPAESRPAVISRIGIGVVLVIAAAIVFLQFTGALAAATDVALAALVVAIAFGVIFAPWVLRLLTSLSAERAERIRSQERAEVAAHLHDSVLQTLALVQKRADDPREVAALARRQERELRSWLSGAPARDAGDRWLAAALEAAADEIEQAHGVPVDVVAVGDARLDRDGEAVVAAAREAMLHAATVGDGAAVAVYAEAGDERLQVFVRDRGPGFDPATVPHDRRGVR